MNAPFSSVAGDARIGTTIADRYFVNQLIGHGGMGDVYKATDLRLDRNVVLKLLKRSLASDPSTVERFEREARASTRLNHSNCITIIDFGQTDDGVLFMAMEYLSGRTVAQVISEGGPLPEARAVRIGVQILGALAQAEDLRIVHRDLKPANVMLEQRRGEADLVKVLDFGIAQLDEPGAGQLTEDGKVWGTPGYMSPEQLRGEELDTRSDLYAAGVILYEMLTGKVPFDADTRLEMAGKQLYENPPPLALRRPGTSFNPALEALVFRALSKDRRERPGSAAEMRELLLACSTVVQHDRSGTSAEAAALPSTVELDRSAGYGLPPRRPDERPSKDSTRAKREARLPRRWILGSLVTAAVVAGSWALLGRVALQRRYPIASASAATANAILKPPAPAPTMVMPSILPVGSGGSGAPTATTPETPLISPGSTARPARPTRATPEAPLSTAPSLEVKQATQDRSVSALATPGTGRPRGPTERVAPVRIVRAELNSVSTPEADSGEGVLSIEATPWAEVSIDGQLLGETPREVLLTAGTHEIIAVHPTLGARQAKVTVVAGERKFWTATFGE